MYSRLTLLSTHLGGRPTIVFSGDVSSTRQHSIRGTPLKKRMLFRKPNQQCYSTEGKGNTLKVFSDINLKVVRATKDLQACLKALNSNRLKDPGGTLFLQ